MNITPKTIITIAGIAFAAIAATFLLWEFVLKGTVTITGDGTITTTVTEANGRTVWSGTDRSVRLQPGTYTVRSESETAGITQIVTPTPLSSTTLALPQSSKKTVSLAAQAPLYGVINTGAARIGFDPRDERLKRIDQTGSLSDRITSPSPAGQEGDWDVEFPNTVTAYQPYRSDKAIVASNNLLYVVGRDGITEIDTAGLREGDTEGLPHLIVATSRTSDSFVVAYKRDVYFYKNTDSKPQKIYTAKKYFDSVTYGGDTIGLYAASVPNSSENVHQWFSEYQIDLLLVRISDKNEHSVSGPITAASLNPAGTTAMIHQRGHIPYMYDLTKRQKKTEVSPSVAQILWLNDTQYVFTRGYSVWQYDSARGSSTLVANFQNEITSVTVDAEGVYWLTTYNGADSTAVYRAGGEASADIPASNLQKIMSLLPYEEDMYRISFSNSVAPTITIHTFVPLNSEKQIARYKDDTLAERQKALQYLKDSGVDLTGVTVMYDPGDPL